MKRLLMIGIPVIILAAAGIGYFGFAHGKPKTASAAAHPRVPQVSVMYPLPSATINLAGDDGFQYLEVQLALVVEGPQKEDALKQMLDDKKPALLDAVNKVVQGQRFSAMRTTQGLQTLSTALESRFDEILTPVHVTHVYFEEFVAD